MVLDIVLSSQKEFVDNVIIQDTLGSSDHNQLHFHIQIKSDKTKVKEGLYRIWCGVNTLGDSGANSLGDTSAFVNPTVQLLLTWRGKIRMDGVGIVFEFNIAPL